MSRIKGGVNTQKVNEIKTQLKVEAQNWQKRKKNLSQINAALGAKLTSLKEVNAELSKRTGFPNLEMAAHAFNVQEQYNELLTVSGAPDPSDKLQTDKDGNFILDKKGRNYLLSEEYQKQFDEETTYWIEGKNLENLEKVQAFKEWYETLEPKFWHNHAFTINGGKMTININKFV